MNLDDPKFEYLTVANQRFKAEHIKQIRFLPMEEMTPHKSIYLSKKPANFQVYPSEIRNEVFQVVVQVLDRSR